MVFWVSTSSSFYVVQGVFVNLDEQTKGLKTRGVEESSLCLTFWDQMLLDSHLIITRILKDNVKIQRLE